MQLKPISRDVIEGAVVEDFYTLICVYTGEKEGRSHVSSASSQFRLR